MSVSGGVGFFAGVVAMAIGLLFWRSRGRAKAAASTGGDARGPAAVPSPTAEKAATPAGCEWALPLVELALADAAATLPAADEGSGAVVEQALSRFAAEPQRLPRRPQLLPELLGTLNDDAASGRQIAAVIARDPALAAGLLRMANSPLYRLQPAPVESLDRAVALVGTQGLRRMMAVALMQPVMRTEGGVFGRLPERIWEHTQQAGVIASRTAQQAGEDPFAAQLLVLLQGLGAIVVVRALRDASEGAGCAAPPAEVVAGLLQRWSPRIGGLVAQEWQLSPGLLGALDEQATADVDAMSPLARALALAGPAAALAMRDGGVPAEPSESL